MHFGNGSQNDDFIINGIRLPNSCDEKIMGLMHVNKLKFEPHFRSATADIVFLRP